MRDRTDWTRTAEGLGRKKNLVQFSRPCATCGNSFSIVVTKKIADGKADSNSFGLKNCEEHRRGTKPASDLETMRAELAVLKQRDKELFAENQALKAKIAALENNFPWAVDSP
jgi:hypothetical protein